MKNLKEFIETINNKQINKTPFVWTFISIQLSVKAAAIIL